MMIVGGNTGRFGCDDLIGQLSLKMTAGLGSVLTCAAAPREHQAVPETPLCPLKVFKQKCCSSSSTG